MASHRKVQPVVSWLEIREKVVEQALEDGDYEALRRISALPGGFGGEAIRRRVWPVLLQVERFCGCASTLEETPAEARPVHKDEAQVGLDTNRSFVTYPSGIPPERKRTMQADLNDLIIGVLRHYPALSYFQGYHDILSVLYLTFIPQPALQHKSRPPSRVHSRASSAHHEKLHSSSSDPDTPVEAPELEEKEVSRVTPEWETLRQCAGAVSVLRVRDAMGSGMEGMMGMLKNVSARGSSKLLKRILKAADPELADFSARISPVPTLPFFALSWILCLFSHNVDTLEPVQRMFDYLLARNPISAIYLAVAILIAKKPQMLKLAQQLGPEAEDDPSLLHPLFSRLPPLFSDTPDHPDPPPADKPSKPDLETDDSNPYLPLPLSELFQLANKLMTEHPWDGPEIRGQEIMGSGSVVVSYELEMAPPPPQSSSATKAVAGEWTLSDALALIDKEVVKPGIGMMDDDEEEETPKERVRLPRRQRRRWLLRLSANRTGNAIAVGVVVLGIGMAVLGLRAGALHASWGRWWAVVLGHSLNGKGVGLGGRFGNLVDTAAEVVGYLRRCLKGIM